jgi:hypothetical protein
MLPNMAGNISEWQAALQLLKMQQGNVPANIILLSGLTCRVRRAVFGIACCDNDGKGRSCLYGMRREPPADP